MQTITYYTLSNSFHMCVIFTTWRDTHTHTRADPFHCHSKRGNKIEEKCAHAFRDEWNERAHRANTLTNEIASESYVVSKYYDAFAYVWVRCRCNNCIAWPRTNERTNVSKGERWARIYALFTITMEQDVKSEHNMILVGLLNQIRWYFSWN